MNEFSNALNGRSILVTGHTGFKGSWLTTWLLELGANVVGFSLPDPPTTPSNFVLAQLSEHITDIRGDIRDFAHLRDVVATHQPELILHMAAQPIVLRGVREPKLTFDANAGGTVNILEAIRLTDSVRALVSITTDKVYANREWLWGYRESDRLGGHDPYSASKAMAELAINAYRDTFFAPQRYDQHGVAIASARAGNVIGGGDFAQFRLVPDAMSALMNGEPIGIRNPLSIRPWQHVLESLSGYLWLAVKLLRDGANYAEAWNFGPQEMSGVSAKELVEKLIDLWGSGSWVHTDPGYEKVETGQLRLSWEKAASRLAWQPTYSWQDTLAEINDWFKAFQRDEDMFAVASRQIVTYTARARELGLPWAGGLSSQNALA